MTNKKNSISTHFLLLYNTSESTNCIYEPNKILVSVQSDMKFRWSCFRPQKCSYETGRFQNRFRALRLIWKVEKNKLNNPLCANTQHIGTQQKSNACR